MKKNKREALITLAIGLLLTVVATFIVNRIQNGRSEKEIVQAWASKWEQCQKTPETIIEISKKEISFECPKESVISDKPTPKDKKWHCKVVLNCEWADWSVSNPQDYCTYEFQNHVSPENPEREIANVPYGGWCREIK